jgi:RHS repeat-associated protein
MVHLRNILVSLLIGSFVLSPITSALAQSSTASGTANSASISIPIGSSSGTLEPAPLSNPTSVYSNSSSGATPTVLAIPPADTAAPSAAAPASAPSSPLTSAPATGPDLQPLVYNSFNQNQVKIDKNTGALNTTFPIDIPPGRNGLQPDLKLIYNSQNTQQGGIFGEGWSISIPYVERLNKTGIDKLYSTSTLNYFTSSLDGELVATTTVTSTASTYVARIDNGTFDRYAFSSSSDAWTMTDKNGTQYAFGSAGDSQQSDPNNSAHVYKWMLKQVTDTNNNTVTYNYFKDSGQIYPSSTLYSGNGSSTGMFEVDFTLATTTSIDNATSSAAGFPVNSNYRVSEIDAKANGTWVRKYALGYTVGDNGYATLLGSIAESGQNASGTVASLPSSTFTYQLQTAGWMSSSTWNPPTPFVSSSSADTGVRIANLAGNGLPGIISPSAAWLDAGNGWVSSSTWDSPVSFTTGGGGDNGYRVMDVNGDGLQDIVSCAGSYLNTGFGWVSSSTWNLPVCFANSGVSTGAIIADANGDGLPDILGNPGSSSSSKQFQVDTNGTLKTNLVSYYPMEGNSNDYYGSNNGSDGSGISYGNPYGKVSEGWNSTGSGKTSATPSNTVTDFSVAFWVNTSSTSVQYIESIGNSDFSQLWATFISHPTGGAGSLCAYQNSTAIWCVSGTYNSGYHFVVLERSGSTDTLYVDNSASSSHADSVGSTAMAHLYLGSNQAGDVPYVGDLDEFGFWNKALSAQERADLYHAGAGQTMANVTSTTDPASYLNTGNGWATSTIWNAPISFTTGAGLDAGSRIADVNGDGLQDIVQGFSDASGTAHFASYLNTGTGWATSTIWNAPATFVADGGWDNGMRIADVNGDGLPDIISGYSDVSGNPSSTAYLNTGHGWTSDAAWDPPTIFSLNGGYDQGSRITDVLGEGLPDIISGYTDFQGTNHYGAWTNDNGTRADLLTGIAYPQGGNSAIQYAAASGLLNGSGAVTNNIPYPVYVVSKITTGDGSGNTASSLGYQYSGGTYYYNGPFDHQSAGFSLVTQTDGAGNVTKTYYHTGNGASSSTGEYADNFWKIGKPYRIDNYGSAGDLYRTTITKWDSASLGGNAAFVFPDQTLKMDYDGLSTHKDSAESYTYSTATGNQTQKIQWGQVTGSNDGTFTDTGSDQYATNYGYASSTTSSVIGKVSDETMLNQSSTKIQETQYYYDNLGSGNVSIGNLTKQEDWKSGSSYVNTVQNTYNGYGLLTQSLDPRNNTSTYAYDSYNVYPATSTNALGQSTGYQYDYSTGKPTQTIDPNGLAFQTSYDGLGRPLAVLQPDQVTTSTLDTKAIYSYTDTANAVSVHESDYLTPTTTVDTYSYYDGLNRLIQARKSATDAAVYKVSDRAYNTIGLLKKESLPYFASSSAETAATGTTALFAFHTYDPLGRALALVSAVGTTTTAYANWKITTTDPNGNIKDAYDDAYGNLIQVGEHNGTSTYTTTYAYDGLRDLSNITDANGNIRNFVYDGLGRIASSTDLHVSTSSTYGIWSYTYDDAGNLTTKADPKSQTITYSYDALNRIASESYGGAVQIAYVYDNCANGVGRLCSASSTDAVALTTKTYDPEGNLASETKKISGTNYTTSYAYDRQGNQTSITNPDSSIVQYAYGAGGLVTGVQEKEPGGSFNALVSAIDYSPTDKITTQTDANGVTTVNTYDPTRLYRLNNTVTTDNGSGLGQMALARLGGSKKLKSFGLLGPSGGTTFSCTGAETSYTVPAGVTKLLISAVGAQGGISGGLGGGVSGTLAVTPGTTYYINVGCQNGYNGGGAGGIGYQYGGSGGGMTWFSANNIFATSTVLMIAGGGGGTGGQGNNGGAGSPGSGGAGGGLNGSDGGAGSSGYCGSHECAGGGGGGTQSAGGSGGTPAGSNAYVGVSGGIGYGGFGGNAFQSGGGGGGAGGGLYGGGGGAGNGYSSGGYMGGGGGGGSSYIAVTAALTATSTTSAVNSGDGSLTIVPVTPLADLNQYLLDGATPLGEGSSTNTGVIFGATLTSSASTTLQLQVEVEPTGTAFINTPNVTSSIFVSPGSAATTTFFGSSDGYHWQARQNDAQGNKTVWQQFGSNSTSTDFILNNTVTESYTGSVQSFTVPAHVLSLALTANGAQGNAGGSGGGTPAPGSGANGGQAMGTLANPSGTYYYWVGQQGGGAGGGGGAQGGGNGGAGGGMTWFSTQNTFDQAHALIIGAGGGGGGGAVYYYFGGGGGTGGGATGGSGGNGGGAYDPLGGSGGSQTSGGSGHSGGGCIGGGNSGIAGSGGTGLTSANNNGVPAGGGGGGGNGYYGGGGGGGINYCNNSDGGGGGGGGSSFASSSLTATSTASGVNSGNGSLVISELFDPVPALSSSTQSRSDGVTTIHEGSSTNQATVVFSAALNSWIGRNLELQVEVEPSGTAFTNVANVTSSPFVAPGSLATTSFSGANGGYHWQARAIDVQNNTSTWQIFGPNSSSTDFVLAAPHITFTFPTNGTTTPNFPNWQLNADTVTSTASYSLNVIWDDTVGDQAQSSTIMATGTQLLAGVNVPKPTSSLDYTYDGTPVMMNATATLSAASTTIATSSVSFTEQTTVAPLSCGSKEIQCVTYQYDNDGNITQVSDNSATNAAITVSYAYDSLNRLTSASSSNAVSGTNYLHAFSYDPVGNILTGPAGTYSYHGTNYTDPDAVTSIVNGTSTTSYAYDNNGNLTNASSGFTYAWDYRNELVTASSTGATSTYGYDFLGQRAKVVNGTSTTYYPETTYDVNGSTTVKHIFFNGALLATVSSAPSSSVVTGYASNDMLGGSNVITNDSGTVVETLAYYPYGAIRIDNTAGSYSGESRKYIGQMYDAATQLSYLNARYYNGTRGQFISEDAVFLALGNLHQTQQLRHDYGTLLATPQSLNSYSYASDNPVVNKDPTGRYFELSYSAEIPGGSWTGGFRFDENGIDYFAGAGPGYGGGGGVELEWAPGQSLIHQSENSINISGQVADGLGIAGSKKLYGYNTEDLYQEPTKDNGTSFGLVLGGGGGGGVQVEASKPLVVWNGAGASNVRIQALNLSNVPIPDTYIGPAGKSTQGSGTIGGQMAAASLVSLQQQLTSLSNALAQLQSTIASYQGTHK